jgi:hypothetical protein
MARTLVVSCGVGRDSTAMLVGLHQRGIRPAAILFADVGSEKQGTYAFIPVLQEWLRKVNFPELTIVRYVPKRSPYSTIEGNMVANATLPGATFGRGSCTMKWKIEPQAKWGRHSPICQEAWARGEKVVKLIGFESCEGYRQKRAADNVHSGKGSPEASRYEWEYPLMDWGWDLERCKQAIDDAGMPLPPKSACWFCPNQQPEEVHDLTDEERARIMRMEMTAEPFNRKVHGLWRRPRKCDGRPGSITEYILKEGLPFVPIESLKPIPQNPACAKSERGYTFRPPHSSTTLAQKVAGEVTTTAAPDAEDTFHRQLLLAL